MPKRKVERKKRRRRVLSLAVMFAIVIIITATYYYFTSAPHEGFKKAVIYDSLHKFIPNDNLLRQLKTMLRNSGYVVDVFIDNNATVENFKKITEYDLIIIRAHGGYLPKDIEVMNYYLKDYMAFIFTGELYNPNRYVHEQRALEIMIGKFIHENGSYTEVFAVSPLFIVGMHGMFKDNSVVIIASCYGLTGEMLAEAFLRKGVSIYIAWPGDVSVEHMDKGLLKLIENALVKGLEWRKAVEQTNLEIGPDPFYNSTLEWRDRSLLEK